MMEAPFSFGKLKNAIEEIRKDGVCFPSPFSLFLPSDHSSVPVIDRAVHDIMQKDLAELDFSNSYQRCGDEPH